MSDPIVKEVRRTRHAIAARFGNDVDRIFAAAAKAYNELKSATTGKVVNFTIRANGFLPTMRW